MGQTGSYLESNRVQLRAKQGRIISQLGWNHDSNLDETCVEPGQIMTRTGSIFVSNRVDS